jgi:Cft2 family RNA processing exonuclease
LRTPGANSGLSKRLSIFFVGYAGPETPGGRLKAATQGETFIFSPSVGEVTKRCDVQDFDLTAHANRDELLDFVGRASPRTVLLGHGDAERASGSQSKSTPPIPKQWAMGSHLNS